MSQKRQRPVLDPQGKSSAQMTTLSYDYRDGHVIAEHFHREDQLVFAAKGVMSVRTAKGFWVVPPLRAVWIPGGQAHSIAMSGPVLMRTLYFAPKFIRFMAKKCLVLNVSPLLRELVIFSCARRSWRTRLSHDRRVIGMILDRLKEAETVPLLLPQPNDPRASRVAKRIIERPDDSETLHELCRGSGASKRTVERLFIEETGMSFGRWRQQLRLLHAMRLLASGEKVTTAALESGYRSVSAFISVFRRCFGTTPHRYLER